MPLFFDGFEQFAKTDRPGTLLRMAGYGFSGEPTIAAGRRSGTSSITLYRGHLQRTQAASGGVLSVGFAMSMDKRGPIFGIYTVGATSPSVLVRSDADTGLVYVGPADGTASPGYVSPMLSRWYYFEVEIDQTAAQVRLYVNGKLDNTQTLPAEVASAGALDLRLNPYDAVENDSGMRSVDDFYINDGARIGPIQVTTRFPTATPTADWGVAGAGAHHDAVSPPVNMLDKYIYSGTADASDQFISATTLPDQGAVRYVQLMTLYRKATSDPMGIELNLGQNVTTLTNIPRDWTYTYTPMPSAGLTPENISATEFGVKLKL